MEFIFFMIGIIVGIVFMVFRQKNEKIHGIVHVDHETESCIFSITSDQLADTSKKRAVFFINHNAQISREEQTL
jgi:hypothetical protein